MPSRQGDRRRAGGIDVMPSGGVAIYYEAAMLPAQYS